MSRLFLAGSALVLALFVSYGILAAGKAFPGLPAPAPGARAIPGAWRLENVRLRVFEGAQKTTDARVASLEIGPARAGLFTLPTLRQARVRGLDATLAGGESGPTRVRADRAKADALWRAWILEGNVRVEGPGTRLHCAKLRWGTEVGLLSLPDREMACLGRGGKRIDSGWRTAEVRGASAANPRPPAAGGPRPR